MLSSLYNQSGLKNFDKLIERYCSPLWKQELETKKIRVEVKKGDYIFKEGDRLLALHIINKGKVKVFTSFEEDDVRILRLAAEGNVLGHRGLGGDFTYSVSAQALTDCSIVVIPLDFFLKMLESNNHFCYYFCMFFAEELKRSEQQVKDISHKRVVQRVAQAIAMNVQAFGYGEGKELAYTLSRAEIASIAATTYESVVRALKTLAQKELIAIRGKSLDVLDEEGLVKIAE